MKLFDRLQPSRRSRRLDLFSLLVLPWFCVNLANAVPMPVIGTPPSVVGSGHSALWFDPERDGEGLVLEILSSERALLYWFTYDEQGEQRWLLSTGEIETGDGGTRAVFSELLVTSGGKFGSAFDPDDVELEVVGSATMEFFGCDQARFAYQAFDQDEIIDMTRLSRTMGVDCVESIHGRTLFPVTDDARLSGSWFEPARSGKGFSLQWLDRDAALVIWYTYDAEGSQRWMIGEGRREGDEIVFDSLQTTRGGQFGPDFDPQFVEFLPWGTLTMNLDCDVGAMTYASSSPAFGDGGMDLTRLTRLAKLDCERQTPELLDLYDFELVAEIPVDSPGYPLDNRVAAMSDDGGVALGTYLSQEGHRLWLWKDTGDDLNLLPREATFDGSVMTANGETIYAVLNEAPDGLTDHQSGLYSWTEVNGWQPLSDTFLLRPIIEGISQNGDYLVGRGRRAPGDIFSSLWIWSASSGQIEVANEEDSEVIFGIRGISNDGQTIVGWGTDFLGPGQFRDRATRWIDGQADFLQDGSGNSLLVAFGCAANCEVIHGGGLSIDSDPANPAYHQAWLWTDSFGTEYIERLPQAVDLSYDAVFAASADGSFLVGDAPIERPGDRIGSRGFIWTRATGVQPLSDILHEVGIDDWRWDNTGVVDVSADGLLWLVSMRRYSTTNTAVDNTWAGLIRLTPRVQPYD